MIANILIGFAIGGMVFLILRQSRHTADGARRPTDGFKWKVPACVSLIWTAVVVVAVIATIQNIRSTSASATEADIRETKLGEVTVGIFLLGHAAVWGLAWKRHQKRAL